MSDSNKETFEERQIKIAEKIRRDEITSFFEKLSEFLFSAPLMLPLYQTWQWLQYGEWPPFTAAGLLTDVFGWTPKVGWLGVQSLLDGVLGTPLLIWLYLTAALFAAVIYGLRKLVA